MQVGPIITVAEVKIHKKLIFTNDPVVASVDLVTLTLIMTWIRNETTKAKITPMGITCILEATDVDFISSYIASCSVGARRETKTKTMMTSSGFTIAVDRYDKSNFGLKVDDDNNHDEN